MRRLWQRWPAWIGPAAAAWAAAYALALAVAAVTADHPVLGTRALVGPAVAVLLAGAAVAGLTLTPWAARVPARAVTAGQAAVAVLALASSCWVLLDLISLVLTGRVEDPHGHSNWLTFAQRLGFVLAGVLFSAAAVAWHRRSTGSCVRCGRRHPAGWTARRYPVPHAAPRGVRRAAYAGCLIFLLYAGAHTLGALGVPGIEPPGFRPPPIWIVPLSGAVALADFLLLGLVRPWGMAFPRWTLWLSGRRVPRALPLTPVWLIAPTLSGYGVILVVVAVLLATGVLAGDGNPPYLIAAAGLSFGGYGIALAVAAVSYQRRTRPRCAAPAGAGVPA
ncbi:hypothetical protein GCM10020358_58890 [Amorphoplanes nipponensis]|uniref:Uncharacterized protein n=1 Tax=Actinoplanes nipponensis TaxID=135950 RepID=A0A919JCI5_9ACTN|nr:hypothetical protein [Actinoplanes nipponensis]GIE46870.1 hypothetical protein Ani05nite_04040 [Actinoplanes nipponensis]